MESPALRAFAICPRCCELYPATRVCPHCDGGAPEPPPLQAEPIRLPAPRPFETAAAEPPATLATMRPYLAAISFVAVLAGMLALVFLVRA